MVAATTAAADEHEDEEADEEEVLVARIWASWTRLAHYIGDDHSIFTRPASSTRGCLSRPIAWD